MKNENGKITVGMLLGVIVLLLIIIVCLVVYKGKVNENNANVLEQNSYTDFTEANENELDNDTLNEFSNKNVTNNSKVSNNVSKENANNNSKTNQNKTTNKELFLYSSGDNAAANGNPELLYVYKMNDNEIDFKYHTPWENEDVIGTANKTESDIYTYTNGNYKIEIMLNSMGENSVKVTEYKNDTISSWKNLFTDEDVSKYITNRDVNTNQTTDYSKLIGEYTRVPAYETEPATLKIIEATEESLKFKVSASSIRVNFNESVQSALDRGAVNIGGYEGIATKISENQWKSTNTEDMEELGKYEVILTLNEDNTIQLETKYDEQYGNVYCGNGVTLEGTYEK